MIGPSPPPHPLTLTGIQDALQAIGITSSDIVLMHSDLRAFGLPLGIGNPDDLLPFYFQALQNATGTLAVPAYFYEYARYNIPFDVAKSPVSLPLGSFSSYLTAMPERVRSCNPLQSIAAMGQHAEALCGGNSLSGYGVTSPWHRLRLLQGKLLFFGVSLQPMTYIHYVEQQYGVPHLYCKIYATPVLKNGIPISGTPVSTVRYLNYAIEYDLSPFQALLASKGILKSTSLGRATIHAVSAQDVFEAAIDCLDKDLYFFLKSPPQFIPGTIPFDGATSAPLAFPTRK